MHHSGTTSRTEDFSFCAIFFRVHETGAQKKKAAKQRQKLGRPGFFRGRKIVIGFCPEEKYTTSAKVEEKKNRGRENCMRVWRNV